MISSGRPLRSGGPAFRTQSCPAAARPSPVSGILAAVLLACVALTGCAEMPTTTSGSGAPPPPSPTAPSDAPVPEDVRLPWPAETAAEAAALQAGVDRGSQPWLLDPTEVAIAYAAAAHGWSDAEAYPGPDGTSVDVRNAEGDRLTLSLAQPARTGDDGIWVVTDED